jgi:putative spermidine/putrescine transport system permease protein
MPIGIVVLMSFSASRYLEFPPPGYSIRWYQNLLIDDTWRSAAITSIHVAAIVAVLATLLGGLAAFGFVRAKFRGSGLLWGIALSPLIVPGVVTAVGAYFLFAHLGLIETRAALILSHTALALPVALISTVTSLRGVDRSLEIAARTLGATSWEAAWRVTLPLIRPGVVTGTLFAFVTSFDEPVVALFIAGTRAITLPKRMWDGIQYEIDPTSAAASSILIFIAAVAVLIADRLSRHAKRVRK